MKCDASGAEIIVADTGVGISDSHIESIFDEFIRVENGARHKPSGFGIGLAIVARMVEAIGADLTVSSREGVGTAFTLRMPVLQAPPPDQSAQL
ncbi:MAG: hypothetical protein A2Z18_08360 [Armatimonadetes bacterium RBG_16_58_9]|nr:MAG: hypothetical protein A2Z18_08360 [Armatimonadetes bacterium RBG_16_58_9]